MGETPLIHLSVELREQGFSPVANNVYIVACCLCNATNKFAQISDLAKKFSD